MVPTGSRATVTARIQQPVTAARVLPMRCRVQMKKSQIINSVALSHRALPRVGKLQQHTILFPKSTFAAISRAYIGFAAHLQPILRRSPSSSQSCLGEHIMLPASACNLLNLKENLTPAVERSGRRKQSGPAWEFFLDLSLSDDFAQSIADLVHDCIRRPDGGDQCRPALHQLEREESRLAIRGNLEGSVRSR